MASRLFLSVCLCVCVKAMGESSVLIIHHHFTLLELWAFGSSGGRMVKEVEQTASSVDKSRFKKPSSWL